MKELICIVDSDPKVVDMIKIATAELCKDFNHTLVHHSTLKELDQFKIDDKLNENVYTMLILSIDDVKMTSIADDLKNLKTKFKTNIVVTAFQDPLKPLKKKDTWPIENLIYKPFDPAILKEHLRFAFIRGEVVKTTAVHSAKVENQIEKIRRHDFLKVSDFGFMIETEAEYNLLEPLKFYHPYFLDQKKSSVWAKAVSRQSSEEKYIYEFIFCAPTAGLITKLRQLGGESKTKIKHVDWLGLEENKSLTAPQIYIQFDDESDFERLKDFFIRKFPSSTVLQFPKIPPKEKITGDLLIAENEFTQDQLTTLFTKAPLYFRISNTVIQQREDIVKNFATETLRLPKPMDRNFLGRMMSSFFPSCVEIEPNPFTWFTSLEPALYSEVITVSQLSEAAFTFTKETTLNRGDNLEFALTQEDETDLKPILSKIQYVDSVPDPAKKFTHQVVFFGIRDDLLKKIRLWMLQSHISQKKS